MFHASDEPGEIVATLIGPSAAIREIREDAVLASTVDARILIAGEYGVGKRRLARLIHQQSLRSTGPFVTIRCSGLPDLQLAIRLFGDGRDITGALSRADGGTLLLQDVDALSPAIQDDLLNFLRSGEFQPVGSPEAIRSTARIVCSTTARSLETRGSDDFSTDLYYVLNSIYIRIPPLRERSEDVEPLLDFFTAYYARRSGVGVPAMTSESREGCRTHPWPANLRQLQAAAAMFALPVPSSSPADILESAARLAGVHRPA
jgi:DNA-binding NtrC family response regulator